MSKLKGGQPEGNFVIIRDLYFASTGQPRFTPGQPVIVNVASRAQPVRRVMTRDNRLEATEDTE